MLGAVDGELIELGGDRVRVCEHQGDGPPILFSAGSGIAAEEWWQVAMLLPDLHWITLDRPGLGGTRWPHRLSTLAEEAERLHQLADRVGEPVVVVAHGQAAQHAEAFTRLHPRQVRAVVLVDAEIDFPTSAPPTVTARLAATAHRLGRLPPVRGLGSQVHRVAAAVATRDPRLMLSRDLLRLQHADRESLAATVAEYSSQPAQTWDLLALRSAEPWPRIATVTMTSGQSPGRDWLVRHDRLSRMLGARQLVVSGGHQLLMTDRPDLIAEAIRSVRL